MLASLLALAVATIAPSPAADLTLSQAVGQRIVVSLPGTTVPGVLARRVRRGEVAGVILFGRNVGSGAQLRALTAGLQAERRRGPRALRDRPLLVMIDQEGGLVKRLPGAPSRSAARGWGRRATSRRCAPRASRPRGICATRAST